MLRCHVCDHEVPPDDVRWMLAFAGASSSSTPPLVVVADETPGAQPTCAWCAQTRLVTPTRSELEAAREVIPDREAAWRECGSRGHVLAEMATVGLEFCTTCLTTFAYGKPIDPPMARRSSITLPRVSARPGDLLILEADDGTFGVFRLTGAWEREEIQSGSPSLSSAWVIARQELGYETRLWVGRAAEPHDLQLY